MPQTRQPSQAEGDRDTVEQDLHEKTKARKRPEPAPAGRPSQAEGDRDTVEQDLHEKERDR